MTRADQKGVDRDTRDKARPVLSALLGWVIRWRDSAVAVILGGLGLVWLQSDPRGLPVVGGIALVVAVTGPLVALGRASGVALAVSVSANLLYGVVGYVASPAGYAPLLLLASLALRRSEKAVIGLAASLAAVGVIALERHRGVNASTVAANVTVVIVFFAAGREIGLWRHRHQVALGHIEAAVSLAEATTRAENLQERLALSGELHDNLGQALAAIGVQSRLARHLLQARRPGVNEALQVVERRAGAALVELQSLATRLADDTTIAEPVPPAGRHDASVEGDRFDLAGGMQGALRLAEIAGLDVRRLEEGTQRSLPAVFDNTVEHVIAEALANAVRHSNATAVVVAYRWNPDTLTVSVTDNGDTTDTPKPGYGLGRLAAQVDSIGGTLNVSARPGGGICVSVHLNLRLDREN